MTQQEIYNRLKERFLTYQNKIQDLDEPGVIAGLFDAAAKVFENLYEYVAATIDRAFIDTATGEDLDRIGALIGCKRRAGTKAVGTLRFYRNTPADRDYFIPKGTRARTPMLPNRLYLAFETTEDALLNEGETFVDVPAQAVNVGSQYNVAANRIVILESPIQGVSGVINPTAFSGGTDVESDDEYRTRIPLYLEGLQRATATALKSAVLTVPGVQDVMVEDGTTPGTAVITVIGVGVDMTAVNAVVQEYKGAGIQITVQEATTQTVDCTFDLYVLPDYNATSVKTNAEQAVTDYLNNLKLAQPAQIAEIIATIMSVDGVDNVKNVLLNGTADDVIPSSTTKIVAGTVTGTVV